MHGVQGTFYFGGIGPEHPHLVGGAGRFHVTVHRWATDKPPAESRATWPCRLVPPNRAVNPGLFQSHNGLFNVLGILVPQDWIDEIDSEDKGDRKKKAAEMTGRFIKKHKEKFQGVHIMPLDWTDVVTDVLEHAEIGVNGG